jgi:hypothetical protein
MSARRTSYDKPGTCERKKKEKRRKPGTLVKKAMVTKAKELIQTNKEN